MIKRIVWFVSGAVAGIGGVLFAGKKVRRRVTGLTPVRIVNRATASTRGKWSNISEAWRDGKEAMHDKESELRARRDGRIESLDHVSRHEPLQPGDEVLVDGERVEPGLIIVLRQVEEPTLSQRKRGRHSPISRPRRS